MEELSTLRLLVVCSAAVTIEFAPGEHLVWHTDGAVTAIGIPKSVYLRVFKAAHSQWHAHAAGPPQQVYQFTLAYLLTTHENHTMMRLHRDATLKLAATNPSVLHDEFKFVVALVTSRLRKLNKSPMLWHWLRHLSIAIGVFEPGLPHLTRLLEAVLALCEVHFANYYAADFGRWCVRILRATNAPLQRFTDSLVAQCRRHVTDVSVWSLLQVVVNPGPHEPAATAWAVANYNSLGGAIAAPPPPITLQPELARRQIHWLIKVKCQATTPYRCMLLAHTAPLIAAQLQAPHDLAPLTTALVEALERALASRLQDGAI